MRLAIIALFFLCACSAGKKDASVVVYPTMAAASPELGHMMRGW